ncbi:MAG TPA: hypothetical protein V6D12_02635, partial [Candidatus Obscuribacterales bacterium]
KNFFGGIAAFFSGLFGSKKSLEGQSSAPKTKKGGGYYMQLDEEDSKPAAKPAQANSKSSSAKQPEPAKAKTAESSAKQPEPAKAKTAESSAKQPEPAKAPQKSSKPEATPAPVANAQPAQRVKLVQEAETLKAEPVKPAASNNGKAQKQSTTTFATDYLIQTSSSTGRRRPGPSLDTFRNLARQVKTPS